jgi:hypothetical protein
MQNDMKFFRKNRFFAGWQISQKDSLQSLSALAAQIEKLCDFYEPVKRADA